MKITKMLILTVICFSLIFSQDTVTLSNVEETDPSQNLGGQLTFYANGSSYPVSSGLSPAIPVVVGQEYSSLTHHIEMGELRHHIWNSENSYKLKWTDLNNYDR